MVESKCPEIHPLGTSHLLLMQNAWAIYYIAIFIASSGFNDPSYMDHRLYINIGDTLPEKWRNVFSRGAEKDRKTVDKARKDNVSVLVLVSMLVLIKRITRPKCVSIYRL